ncbi:hypothetical protein [Sphingomonas sp. GC_Shp_3]|uniref:hypothetical protein n=1 Tax=Sphingomonas sp. GC_Shp_3 TaxID=2937383 RepID=UPI00226984A1|nr:hypothetical protein [Sphingomonas sp. GC_Shp_3]
MDHISPVLSRVTVIEDHDRSQPSTYCEHPSGRSRTNVPPVIAEIVAKLGLRYLPSGQADREAHAESLLLLGEDLADVPAQLLDEAARRWAKEEKFMPRASEIRDVARRIQGERTKGTASGDDQLQRQCDTLNAKNVDWHWVVAGTAPNRSVVRVR